jgi:hypothetical protein
MRAWLCRALVIVLTLLACSAVCSGQAAQSKSNCGPDVSRRAAYTADFRYTSVSLTANGDTNTCIYDGTEATDSQGRTIVSTTMPSASGKGIDITGARIFDPVNGTETIWNSDQGQATVWAMPPAEQRHGCWQLESSKFRFDLDKLFPEHCALVTVASGNSAGDTGATPVVNSRSNRDAPPAASADALPKRESKVVPESLGISVIAGVRAYGVREIWPIDPNMTEDRSGNDTRPWVSEEHWVATEYRELWVRQIVDYPEKPNATKRWSKELVNFKPGDPALNAYEPPPNFPVVTRGMYPVPCGSPEAQKP